MRSDDDFDDFSHLPTVEASPSAEEKHRLWKTHSRREAHAPEPHPAPEPKPGHQQEMMEQQLLEHELPVEQELLESHATHAPEWAEDDFGAGTPAVAEPEPISARAAASEPPEWVREAFGTPQPAPKPKAAASGATLVYERVREEAEEELPAAAPPPQPQDRASSKRQAATKPAGDEEHKLRPAEPRPSGQAQQGLPSADEEPIAKQPIEKPRAKQPPAAPEDIEESEADAAPAQHHPMPEIHVEELPPEEQKKRRLHALFEKIGLRGLAWSLGVHVLFLIAAAVVVVTVVGERQVDFLSGRGSQSAKDASAERQHKVQAKKNTWLSKKPTMKRVVSLNSATAVTLPEAPPDMLDIPDQGSLLSTRTFGGGGFGGGIGSGLALGGKVSFLGNTATGRRVVYVVDVSGSMSQPGPRDDNGRVITRFDLLKKELVRSLDRMPVGTEYQVLYFSDFAWPHNEVNSRDTKAWEKYRWEITPERPNVGPPRFRYIKADMMSILRSRDIINDSENPGGTNWGSGLFMAMRGSPKPDIIFFMTDGNKTDATGWVDAVTEFNHRSGKPTRIYTTAMMEPDAAEELEQLAKRNGGTFTVVLSDGTILTSEEFFKRRGG